MLALTGLGLSQHVKEVICPYHDVARAEHALRALRSTWAQVFEDVDVVVTPTLPAPAAPIEDRTVQLPSGRQSAELSYLFLNAPMNLGGVPALTLPCGDAAGLPIGMTLTAARDRDSAVLSLGEAYETATGRAFANRIAPD